MKFGLIVIGDEILNGRRTDAHFPFVKQALLERGLQLAWVEYVADVRADIVQRLARSALTGLPVLVTGGIGATPDDHTRQSAAQAFELPLFLHPQAAHLINTVVAERLNETNLDGDVHRQRLQMAVFPQGAQLIPNPYNQVAGFSVNQHYFFPGFPVMAHPMMEWVLDTLYADAQFKDRFEVRSAMVYGIQEPQLAPLMLALEAEYTDVQTFSLPKLSDDQAPERYVIEYGIKAAGAACDGLDAIWAAHCQQLIALGARLKHLEC